MLNFQCGVDPSDAATVGKATDRDYSSYIVDLHGLEMNKSDKVYSKPVPTICTFYFLTGTSSHARVAESTSDRHEIGRW